MNEYEEIDRLRTELAAEKTETERLRNLIDRDRTGLALAIGQIVKVVIGRLWITEGRGPYEWDDDKYKEEAGVALRTVLVIARKALSASGMLADSAFHPDRDKTLYGGPKL